MNDYQIVLTLTKEQHVDVLIAIQDRLREIRNCIEVGNKHNMKESVTYFEKRHEEIEQLQSVVTNKVKYEQI